MADRALAERLLELLAHAEPAQRQAGRELLASLDHLAASEIAEIEVQALHQRMVVGLREVAEGIERWRVQDMWLLVSPDLAAAARAEAALVASPLRQGARRIVVVVGVPGPIDLIVAGARMIGSAFTAGDAELALLVFGKGRGVRYAIEAPYPAEATILGHEYAHQSHRPLLLALDQKWRKRKVG